LLKIACFFAPVTDVHVSALHSIRMHRICSWKTVVCPNVRTDLGSVFMIATLLIDLICWGRLLFR